MALLALMMTIHLSLFASPLRAAPADPCQGVDVHTFTAPDLPYSVRYQVLNGSRKDLPLLIYLQGGPAGRAIANDDMPNRPWTEVRMDPPSVGCSQLPAALDLEKLDLSTNQYVELWSRVIHQLKIKRVSLQGRSYGTQVATQLAARLEADGDVEVMSVIQEGTTGPVSPTAYPQWADGYLTAWDELRKQYPTILSDTNMNTPKPFGIETENWISFVVYVLTWDVFPENGKLSHYVRLMEELADPRTSVARHEAIRGYAATIHKQMQALTNSYLYQRQSCEESNPSGVEYDFTWSNGRLDLPNQGFCEGKPWTVKNPYDPTAYTYKAPTIYIEGGRDPNTPLGGKLYHIDTHLESARTLILTKLGGHGVLETGVFRDCKKALITNILEKNRIEKADFSSCVYQDFEVFQFDKGEKLGKFPVLTPILEEYRKKLGLK